jgi:hypothetical protein
VEMQARVSAVIHGWALLSTDVYLREGPNSLAHDVLLRWPLQGCSCNLNLCTAYCPL